MKFITSFVWKKKTELCDDLQKSSQVLPPVSYNVGISALGRELRIVRPQTREEVKYRDRSLLSPRRSGHVMSRA